MRTIKRTAFFTALLLLAGTPVRAETVLQYSPVQASGASSGSQTIFIRNGKIRMETTAGGKTQVTLFDQAAQSFTALNDERRTYMVIGKNFSNDMQRRVQDARSQAMAKMKERTHGMSPERRSLIESAMAGRMQQPQAPAKAPYNLKNTGKTESIHGIPCRTVLAYRGAAGENGNVCRGHSGIEYEPCGLPHTARHAGLYGKDEWRDDAGFRHPARR